MAGPLQGVRILDITTVIMGPYATSILADLGADVLKVEPPGGDIGRQLGPARHEGMSALALNLHRNKRSVVVDLTTTAGKEVLRELIEGCDAVVTNLRPGARERLGLTAEDVLGVNPSSVLCTAQAFSATSAERDAPAYDDIVQAASGMCDTYRRVYGEPRYSPSVLADKVCGMAIVNALLSALLYRDRTGEGQWVDVPMVDTMVAFNLVEHLSGHTFVPEHGDIGWSRTLVSERKPHAAKDGWICVMPYTDRNWRDFLNAVGCGHLTDDERFATANARHHNAGPLQSILADIVRSRTVKQWLELSARLGIAAHEVLDLEKLDQSPYLRSRQTLRRVDHPTEGSYRAVRFPADFSHTPADRYLPAPRLADSADATWLPRSELFPSAAAVETGVSA